jgi:hypothetical protein
MNQFLEVVVILFNRIQTGHRTHPASRAMSTVHIFIRNGKTNTRKRVALKSCASLNLVKLLDI